MADPVHLEAIERILGSISGSGEFQLTSFLFGRPGARLHERNLGTNIYANRREFIRSLLFIRANGAAYLRSLPISDIWSRVTNFITENYWHIAENTFGTERSGPFSQLVSLPNKLALADELAISSFFQTPDELSLFPLLTVRCEVVFEASTYFLVPADQLTTERVWGATSRESLDGTTIPPFPEWDGRRRSVVSWIGVHAALPPIARKRAAAILGSLALTQISRLRHMFSGREMHGGLCTIGESWSYTPSDEPHTPALMEDIVLTAADRPWLARLENLLLSDDLVSRRHKRALEYFYRAWFLDPRERFPILCMSLDSLVGTDRNHTSEAVRYVTRLIPTADVERVRLLMRIRGAVIHGAAPDVYESENYERYYIEYETDPIRDIELITSKCLREDIFAGNLPLHEDPNRELIEQMQRLGRLPARMDDGQIIRDDF